MAAYCEDRRFMSASFPFKAQKCRYIPIGIVSSSIPLWPNNFPSQSHIRGVYLHQDLHLSEATLKPLTGNVNNIDHPFTTQCSAGKTWVLAFMWLPLDLHHLTTAHHGNITPSSVIHKGRYRLAAAWCHWYAAWQNDPCEGAGHRPAAQQKRRVIC